MCHGVLTNHCPVILLYEIHGDTGFLPLYRHAYQRKTKSNLFKIIVGRNLINIFIGAAYYNFIFVDDCFVTPWIIILPGEGTQFVSE